jgi:YqjK-like protein
VTRDRLSALSEQRTRLVARARVEREHLDAMAARIEASLWWVDVAHKGMDAVRSHPLLVVAAIALLVVLRPRGAMKLLASSWSLWRLYQRARRLWTAAAALAAGAATQNR